MHSKLELRSIALRKTMDLRALGILFFLGFAACCCRSADADGPDCEGRRVYMYDLPPQFNAQILQQCEFGLARWLNVCPHAANEGFGEPYAGGSHATLGEGWFDTNSYMLEVIYHARMRRYRCLTRDPARADAFFVPYYAGLDALRYLYDGEARSLPHGHVLMSWIREKGGAQWERRRGSDHFLVMGRTAWDFAHNRGGNGRWSWGTGMLNLPGVANMTALLIERRPWRRSEQGVPYPTSFHPSAAQLVAWVARVRRSPRTALFAFAGSARRPQAAENFRGILFRLCAESDRCELVDCGKSRCSHDSEPIISAFLRSTFCLQPKGDTATRRSTFDSIIAGCIPVFFDEDSAYTQYTWHLPPDPGSYSVYISEDTVASDPGSIQRVLESIPPRRLREMQRNVAASIPGVVYMATNSSGSSPPLRDAFDISVQGVLDRIAGLERRDSPMASGNYYYDN